MSTADLEYLLHLVRLTLFTALIYGYNVRDHPPFWKLMLISAPIAFLVSIVTILILGVLL